MARGRDPRDDAWDRYEDRRYLQNKIEKATRAKKARKRYDDMYKQEKKQGFAFKDSYEYFDFLEDKGLLPKEYQSTDRPGGLSSAEFMRGYADGGMIPSGSYVVNQSAASANSDFLNSIGSSWVTGGTPGKDSVMFGIGMANGGSPSIGNALLMPGEAVVPPEFAHIGEAINNGVSSFATGGSLDSNAMKDITSGSPNRLKKFRKRKIGPRNKSYC